MAQQITAQVQGRQTHAFLTPVRLVFLWRTKIHMFRAIDTQQKSNWEKTMQLLEAIDIPQIAGFAGITTNLRGNSMSIHAAFHEHRLLKNLQRSTLSKTQAGRKDPMG